MYNNLQASHLNGGCTESFNNPDLSREHPQFLKVDQTVDNGVVTIKEEREVFLDDGKEWYQRGLCLALEFTVLDHIVKRIHERTQILCKKTNKYIQNTKMNQIAC